jgi:hypothetical protein
LNTWILEGGIYHTPSITFGNCTSNKNEAEVNLFPGVLS